MLLESLDELINDPEKRAKLENQPSDLSWGYTLFLLAKFKEKRAFTKIRKLMSLAIEFLNLTIGDMITENLGSILYSTFDEDSATLTQLITNLELDAYVRSAALAAYGKLVSENDILREEGLQFFRQLIKEAEQDNEIFNDPCPWGSGKKYKKCCMNKPKG